MARTEKTRPAAKAGKVTPPADAPVEAPALAIPALQPTPAQTQPKETTMTTTTDFTKQFADAAAKAQDQLKANFTKGSALLADAGEFSKANAEALVESGKILAAGVQDLGKDYVAAGKSAFETMVADAKELAAVKTPADFLKLQGELLRRNFDAAVALGSQRSEALVKLANDSFAPISTRISVAIDKVKQAA